MKYNLDMKKLAALIITSIFAIAPMSIENPLSTNDANAKIDCAWDLVYWPKAVRIGFSSDGYGNFWLPSGQHMTPGRAYYVGSVNHFFVVRGGALYYSTYCE